MSKDILRLSQSIYNPIRLPRLRPTALQEFEMCPRSWAEKHLVSPVADDSAPKNKYAMAGTVAHKLIELAIRKYTDQPPTNKEIDSATDDLIKYSLNETEIDNVSRYIQELCVLLDNGYRVVSYEEKFLIPMYDGVVPIGGTQDLILLSPEGDLIIRDHKTNRRPETVEQWKQKLQPLLYAWAARRKWQGFNKLIFEIGYINMGYVLSWKTSPEDDKWLERRIWELWERMQEYSRTGIWPAFLNQYCGYCPIKEICPEYKSSVTNFSADLFNNSEFDVAYKYEQMKLIRKAAKSAEDELEEELKRLVKENGGTYEEGDLVYTQEYGSRREIPYHTVVSIMEDLVTSGEIPAQLYTQFIESIDTMFPTKVTELDKLIKLHPAIKHRIEPKIEKKQNNEPTLKVDKKQKVLK